MTYWRNARERGPAASARPGIRLAAIVAVLGLVVVGSTVTSASAADDYPTYADVQAAKGKVTKQKALLKRIEATIDGLQSKVESTQAAATAAGEDAQVADQAFQEQALKAQSLQAQADQATTDAATAKTRAGELLVQQYRQNGNTDITVDLLLNAENSEDILYSLGMSKTLVDQAQNVFTAATLAKNTAQSLSDQAAVAQAELEKLKKVADEKLAVAGQLADAAAVALQNQQDNIDKQNELKAALESKAATTAAGYQKGVEVREKARLAALAKAQAAALAAAQAGAPAGSSVNTADPQYSVDGQWVRPAYGHITSGFGYRKSPWGGSSIIFHLGTDIGAACGSNIYAAHAGTVSYSGWNGVYGNFIRIDIGSGVQNEYGHILQGGLKVSQGQEVKAGDLIALVGKTGGATGCHLHFGVRINGLVTDPVPFAQTNGMPIG